MTSVSVSSTPAVLGRDATETLTVTVRTNGHPGTLRYHWVRSDGTDSGPLTQDVGAGVRQAQLPPRWTVQGHGSLHGTATLKVTAPGTAQAAAGFDYACP
ncbi:hypothetical protein [Streptomyces sp. JNUCC 63]